MSKVQQVTNGMSAATAASYWNEAVRSGYIETSDFAASAFKDEDDMASNSATAVSSQRSVKAYVDSKILTREISKGFHIGKVPSGTHYLGGWYKAPAADANLTNASPTVTYGTANIAYGARAFVVAGGAGTTDGSDLVLTVSGTSIATDGTRTGSDSEVIVADCTAATTNAFYQTSKRWIGQITFTLTSTGGATFGFDFNYGFARIDNVLGTDFNVIGLECEGDSNTSDTSFDIELIYHNTSDWTYSAAAFVPGSTVLCSMANDYAPENNLNAGDYFSYFRSNLFQPVNGDDGEGVIIRITQGANNVIEHADFHIRAQLAQGTIT